MQEVTHKHRHIVGEKGELVLVNVPFEERVAAVKRLAANIPTEYLTRGMAVLPLTQRKLAMIATDHLEAAITECGDSLELRAAVMPHIRLSALLLKMLATHIDGLEAVPQPQHLPAMRNPLPVKNLNLCRQLVDFMASKHMRARMYFSDLPHARREAKIVCGRQQAYKSSSLNAYEAEDRSVMAFVYKEGFRVVLYVQKADPFDEDAEAYYQQCQRLAAAYQLRLERQTAAAAACRQQGVYAVPYAPLSAHSAPAGAGIVERTHDVGEPVDREGRPVGPRLAAVQQPTANKQALAPAQAPPQADAASAAQLQYAQMLQSMLAYSVQYAAPHAAQYAAPMLAQHAPSTGSHGLPAQQDQAAAAWLAHAKQCHANAAVAAGTSAAMPGSHTSRRPLGNISNGEPARKVARTDAGVPCVSL